MKPDSRISLEEFSASRAYLVDAEQVVVGENGTMLPTVPPTLPETVNSVVATLPLRAIAEDDAKWAKETAEVTLGDKIGVGGMGVVRHAKQHALGRQVAVKYARPDQRPNATAALLREAMITGRLEHPNIVPIHTLCRTPDGEPVIVMKRIGGDSWRARLFKTRREGEPDAATTNAQIEVLLQVCNAVRFAHSNRIVHRDLKPENVMIGDFGEVYVLDWGLAIELCDEPVYCTEVVGTPDFMAPEMVDSELGPLGEHSDIYLLGAILHEIITGQARHQGGTVLEKLYQAFRSDPYDYGDAVPVELAAVCNRAMHRDVEQRFSSVEAFAEAIRQILENNVSRELCAGAQKRQELLLLVIAEGDADPAEVHRIFLECRFGFQQALKSWPQNSAAKRGLRAALHTMAEVQIDRGVEEAASRYIDEIEAPDEALLVRFEALRKKRAEERQHIEKLERMRQEIDVRLGQRVRSYAMIPTAAVFCAINLLWAILARKQIFVAEYGTYALVNCMFSLTVVFAMVALRLNVGIVNRRAVAMSLTTACGFFALYLLGWLHGVPFRSILVIKLLMLSIIWAAGGIAIDRRVLGGAIAFLATMGIALLFPGYEYELNGIGGGIGLGLTSWGWSRGRASEATRSADPQVVGPKDTPQDAATL